MMELDWNWLLENVQLVAIVLACILFALVLMSIAAHRVRETRRAARLKQQPEIAQEYDPEE